MHKIATLALAATVAAASVVPASAASMSMSFGSQGRYVQNQCEMHPNWKGCHDWKQNGHHWGKNEYRNWYGWNRPNLGNVAAGLFGFAIGAAIVNGISRSSDSGYDSGYDSHVSRCEARFRSYNAETDKYLGYDGRYHYCEL
jgi:hypothetical protein